MYKLMHLYMNAHQFTVCINVCHGSSQFLCRSVGQPWAVLSAPRCSITSWLMALKRRPLSSSFCQILGGLEFVLCMYIIYIRLYKYIYIYMWIYIYM